MTDDFYDVSRGAERDQHILDAVGRAVTSVPKSEFNFLTNCRMLTLQC